jgi:hypothetical protein
MYNIAGKKRCDLQIGCDVIIDEWRQWSWAGYLVARIIA